MNAKKQWTCLFLILLFWIVALAVIAPAQCSRGTHPPGVFSVPGSTPGCDEITNGLPPWLSLSQTLRIGGDLNWSLLDPPHRSNVCPAGIGIMVVGTGATNVLIPGSRACWAQVPLGIFAHALVPLCRGCHSVHFLRLPDEPVLVGVRFRAQAHIFDRAWATSNVIEVEVRS